MCVLAGWSAGAASGEGRIPPDFPLIEGMNLSFFFSAKLPVFKKTCRSLFFLSDFYTSFKIHLKIVGGCKCLLKGQMECINGVSLRNLIRHAGKVQNQLFSHGKCVEMHLFPRGFCLRFL